MQYLLAVLAIVIGIAGIVAAGIDDSPGGQLLGLLLVIGGIALVVRKIRRSKKQVPGS
jgi:drug/metabolite transporter (DMT)-like permease